MGEYRVSTHYVGSADLSVTLTVTLNARDRWDAMCAVESIFPQFLAIGAEDIEVARESARSSERSAALDAAMRKALARFEARSPHSGR